MKAFQNIISQSGTKLTMKPLEVGELLSRTQSGNWITEKGWGEGCRKKGMNFYYVDKT